MKYRLIDLINRAEHVNVDGYTITKFVPYDGGVLRLHADDDYADVYISWYVDPNLEVELGAYGVAITPARYSPDDESTVDVEIEFLVTRTMTDDDMGVES